MKIIVVCSTLDLSKPYGATPSLWQLFKAFYEEGVELLVIPYHGHSIDSIWWRGFQNLERAVHAASEVGREDFNACAR